MNLPDLAKGRTCTIRIPGVCLASTETTVLAHYRGPGAAGGTAFKPTDLLGAHACAACHEAVDQGLEGWTRSELWLVHLQGVARTLERLERLGIRVSIETTSPRIV